MYTNLFGQPSVHWLTTRKKPHQILTFFFLRLTEQTGTSRIAYISETADHSVVNTTQRRSPVQFFWHANGDSCLFTQCSGSFVRTRFRPQWLVLQDSSQDAVTQLVQLCWQVCWALIFLLECKTAEKAPIMYTKGSDFHSATHPNDFKVFY